jgi:hypothetical protein
MLNLSETNGGYLGLSSAGASAGTTTTLTTANTVAYAVNGILKTLTAQTNAAGTFLPSAVGSTYQGQIVPKNLINSQKCNFIWALDYSGTIYILQGAIVTADQISAPIPAPQGQADPVSNAGAVSGVSGTSLPQAVAGIVPIALFNVTTNAANGLQLPSAWGAPTAAAISGVTFQTAWGGTGITTVVYNLFNYPSNPI